MRSPSLAIGITRLACLVLAAVLVAGCSGGALLTEADFADIVLAASAAPAGMKNDGNQEGNAVLTRLILNRAGYDLGSVFQQPGFVAGRYAEFGGEAGLLLSWAALFDTTDNAKKSFALYLAELRSPEAYGFAADVPAGLGDEGYCDEGDVGGPDGPHWWICLWRVDNAVLVAGGAPADVVRDTAEGMDARAR